MINIDEILESAKGLESSAGLFHDGYEGYFDQHKQRIKPTDGDFSKAPQIDRQEFIEFNRYQPEGLSQVITNLLQHHAQNFPQWALELSQNYNLCLYGVGSKLDLLENFLEYWSPGIPIVVANCFKLLEFKEILNFVVAAIVPEDIQSKWYRKPNERITSFFEYLDQNPRVKVALIIYSIDSEYVRDSKSLEMMARLVSHQNIYCIATCDHIKAPVLWSSQQSFQLGFIWHNVTTFIPAIQEYIYQDVSRFGKSNTKSTTAIATVLDSLTSNAKKLFQLLIQEQYNTMAERNTELNAECKPIHGISSHDLLDLGLAEFIVSSEDAMKRVLIEYTSHEVLKTSRTSKGVEVYYIPGSFSDIVALKEEFCG